MIEIDRLSGIVESFEQQTIDQYEFKRSRTDRIRLAVALSIARESIDNEI